MTFIEVDFTSLKSVRESVRGGFKHERLDILMCTAGVMTQPPVLSKDGYGMFVQTQPRSFRRPLLLAQLPS